MYKISDVFVPRARDTRVLYVNITILNILTL